MGRCAEAEAEAAASVGAEAVRSARVRLDARAGDASTTCGSAIPLAPGIARVWQQYVMINDDDVRNATLAHHDVVWREVWRGKGKIIYEREVRNGWIV